MTEQDVLLRFVQISDTHLADAAISEKTRKYTESPVVPAQVKAIFQQLATNQGDLAPYQRDRAAIIRSIEATIARINGLPVPLDFVLHTGDVCFDPTSAEAYAPVQDLFAGLDAPIYYMVGNHDDSQMLQQALSHLDSVKPTFDYEIPHAHMQIICLETAVGHLTERQLAWLDERLAADERPALVAMHHNPVSYGEFFGDLVILRNHAALRDLLGRAQGRLRGVFYGHMHIGLDVVQAGISYHCCPSLWTQFDVFPHAPATRGNDGSNIVGFNLVTITTEQTFVRRIHYAVD